MSSAAPSWVGVSLAFRSATITMSLTLFSIARSAGEGRLVSRDGVLALRQFPGDRRHADRLAVDHDARAARGRLQLDVAVAAAEQLAHDLVGGEPQRLRRAALAGLALLHRVV